MTALPAPTALPIVAALAYAARGYRPLPLYAVRGAACTCPRPQCGSPGKHPRLDAWQHKATSDAATVREWFRRWPDSNIGLAMGGPMRLVALDVDGAEGRASLQALEDELGALPDTLTSRSGRADGGEHRIFVLHEDVPLAWIKNRAGVLGPGLDVRAEGGQIAVCPSLHASGGRYRWTDERPAVELPLLWAERLCSGRDAWRTVCGVYYGPELGCGLPAGHIGPHGRGAPETTTPQRALPPSTPDRPQRYARAILDRACLTLTTTPKGRRNDTAAAEAFALGGLLWTGAFSAESVVEALRHAMRAGDWSRAAEGLHLGTIRRQLAAGAARPRTIPPERERGVA